LTSVDTAKVAIRLVDGEAPRWHPAHMLKLLDSKAFVVEFDMDRGLIRATRSEIPFASAEDVDAAYAELFAKLERFDRKKLVALGDMRKAPRTAPDSDIEVAQKRNVRALSQGFRRTAVLLRTPVGMLQASRVKSENDAQNGVFLDEDKALAYLLAPEK
jgi:hypothetical protein